MDLRASEATGDQRKAQGERPPRGRHRHMYAAIDLGTNNCRALIARPRCDGFEVVDSFSRLVRLGEGLDRNGRLSEAAMARTVSALGVCADKLRRHGVSRGRYIATEACRRAVNGDAFLDRAHAATGLYLEVIGADEEAHLALSGCAPLLDNRCSRAIVFDIGGGSTELIWLAIEPDMAPRVLDLTSLRCGVVTMAERHGGHSVPPPVYAAMVDEATNLLSPFEAANGIAGQIAETAVHMLGTSGTVTTLAAVHLDLARYDRARIDGSWMKLDDVQNAAQRLLAMDYDDRVSHPCIRRGRADLVVAGCAILEAILRAWPVESIRVADRGLREGMLLALMDAADAEVVAGI